MAQVIKKFQSGGTAPTKKYGTFTIDGNKYEVDDNFLNQLTSYGKTLDDEDTAYQFSKITDALRSGADLSYDSNANRLDGPVSFDVKNNQQSRLEQRRTRAGRFLGNLWGGKESASRHAINALKGFEYVAPASEPVQRNEYKWNDTLYGEYKRNKETGDYELIDGKKVYINGANNLRISKRLNSLKDIANYNKEDKFIGFNNLDRQVYIDLYNRLGDQGVNDLISRIEQGTWTDEDAEALDDIGIYLNGNSKSKEAIAPKTEEEQRAAKASSYDKKYNITPEVRDRFGIVYGNNGELYTEGFGLQGYGDTWRNAYFGDNFVQQYPGLKQFKDYILYNGRLYSKNEWADPNSQIHKELSSPNVNIFERMRNNLFDPSQNGGWQVLWTNDPYTRYNRNTQYNPYFDKKYADDNNVVYSYVTSAYQGLPSGVNVLDVIDSNTQRNEFGVPISGGTPLALDEKGNPIDISSYIRSATTNSESTGNAFQRLLGNEAGAYKGWIWEDILNTSDQLDENGQPIQNYSGWSILYNPRTGQEAYYDDEKQRIIDPSKNNAGSYITWWENGKSGNQVRLSQISNWDANIQRALRDIIDRSQLSRNPWFDFNDQIQGKRFTPVSFNRAKLNIPMKQTGGLINWKSEDQYKDSKAIKVRNTKKAATTSQIKAGDLTDADKWQLGALAGDLGALVASIPTGGNPVAAGLGVGSTVAQFTADVKRDGLDVGDIGNALLGLGLDAVTFIPGVGIAGKAAKTAKIIRKMKPMLSAGFSALGLSAAYDSLNKNSEWTLDDYRNILFGVQGLLGSKRVLDRTIGYKKTGLPVNSNEKVSPKKLQDLQKQTADKLVKDNPDRFKGKDWVKNGKIADYTKALADDEIKSALPKNKFYNESLSKLQSKYQNAKNKSSNWLTGESKELRFRTKEELPWFLQNAFGERLLHRAQFREFGNVAHRLNNRNHFLQEYNPLTMNQRAVTPIWRRMGNLNPREEAYYNPFIFKRRPTSTDGNRSLNLPVLASHYNYRFYKRGGKIVKAQLGDVITMNPVEVTAKSVTTPKSLINNYSVRMGEILNNAVNNLNTGYTPSTQLASNNTQSSKSTSRSAYGNSVNKPINVNPDMLLGAADFFASARAINKTANIEKDAIRKATQLSQQQKPTEFYSTFNDNGLFRSYDDRIKNIRQYKTVTNDPNQVMAERLMRDQQADQLIGERDTKFSQLIGEYNDKLLGQKQTYANIRNQIENENRIRLAEGLRQESMVDARKTMQNAQNLKSLIYQLRTDLGKDQSAKAAAESQLKQMRANAEFQAALEKYRPEYNNYINSLDKDDVLRQTTFESWLQNNKPKEYISLQNQHYADYIGNLPNLDPKFWFHGRNWADLDTSMPQFRTPPKAPGVDYTTYRFKSGGKVSGRNVRPVNDQHYLDQNKDINKAIRDLNNNIIRLFIKMMS